VRGLTKRGIEGKHLFPHVENGVTHDPGVARALQSKLGQFLRRRRGDMTYTVFVRKLGISVSSLHRMEMGEQNVTLNTLEHLLKRLNCDLNDIFGPVDGD